MKMKIIFFEISDLLTNEDDFASIVELKLIKCVCVSHRFFIKMILTA